ncbi:MAG: glycosyltransferase family 2 protein, partial [Candidatus Kerfeldbacteria bacterium]|nr:glycosyltransferase family 2 protein [Candidatus Kerfeldbacteria bacterium]
MAIEAANARESFMQAVIHVVEETPGIDLIHQYPANDMPDAVDHLTVTIEAETACLTVTARKKYRSQSAAIFVADNTNVSTVATALAENLRRHSADVVVINDDDAIHHPDVLEAMDASEEDEEDVPGDDPDEDDDLEDAEESLAEFPPHLRQVAREKKPRCTRKPQPTEAGKEGAPMASKTTFGPVLGKVYEALLAHGTSITREDAATFHEKFGTQWPKHVTRLREKGVLTSVAYGVYTLKKVPYEIEENGTRPKAAKAGTRRNDESATRKRVPRRKAYVDGRSMVVVGKTVPMRHRRTSSRQLVTAFSPLIEGARRTAQFIHALEEQNVTVTFEDGAVHLVIHP